MHSHPRRKSTLSTSIGRLSRRVSSSHTWMSMIQDRRQTEGSSAWSRLITKRQGIRSVADSTTRWEICFTGWNRKTWGTKTSWLKRWQSKRQRRGRSKRQKKRSVSSKPNVSGSIERTLPSKTDAWKRKCQKKRSLLTSLSANPAKRLSKKRVKCRITCNPRSIRIWWKSWGMICNSMKKRSKLFLRKLLRWLRRSKSNTLLKNRKSMTVRKRKKKCQLKMQMSGCGKRRKRTRKRRWRKTWLRRSRRKPSSKWMPRWTHRKKKSVCSWLRRKIKRKKNYRKMLRKPSNKKKN